MAALTAWPVLVSEVMLQQTQVSRVVPRWHAFLSAFPSPEACAAASVGAVIGLWAGLGYNRRAVQLHRAAREIVSCHGGQVPSELRELQALPGVGAYTARAVVAFAFEGDAGVVDTNVARVLARALAGRPLRRTEAQDVADSAVPPGQAWRWNQAMLDLGVAHCTSGRPACSGCPLAANHCAWARAGYPLPDPAVGTAGVSGPQSAFVGSHRQGRGRLVAALRGGPIDTGRLAEAAGWPEDPSRAARAAASLVADGLAVEVGGRLMLP